MHKDIVYVGQCSWKIFPAKKYDVPNLDRYLMLAHLLGPMIYISQISKVHNYKKDCLADADN